jgi:predicted Zn-dependent peptidase
MHRLPDPIVHRLPGGLRTLVLPLPHLQTACVSAFVASGSAHEGRRDNGISHMLEHMAFKGSATRDARAINVDAERLGAEVNAHTDRDHTAYHLRGLAEHHREFVRMLADIVLAPTFPDDELQRERQVLLHELTEDEEDPMSTAFKLFDNACFGLHPTALPVIGQRRVLERLTRDDLLRWHEQHLRAGAIVVAAAGPLDAEAFTREVETAFAAARPGSVDGYSVPEWHGGIKTRHLSGHSQAHLVLGWPIPALTAADPLPQLAAAMFGEGMSSPLMHELREQRGLFYYGACSADQLATHGQLIIEASVMPEQRDEFLREVLRLLHAQVDQVDADDLKRGRNLLKVRLLRDSERPVRALEDAAIDLMFLGQVRPLAQRLQRLDEVGTEQVAQCIGRALSHPLALAATGQLGRSAGARLRELIPV